MILYKGLVYENKSQNKLIANLKEDCYHTLEQSDKINPIDVINACNILAKKVRNKEFDHIILPLLVDLDIPYEIFESYIYMFEKEALIKKLQIELGIDYQKKTSLNEITFKEILPLGILFHISAGNIDALPAYSVIEGLLSGNINILKLPTGDSGLSILLLKELIKIEPKITEYVYVFDTPSTELETLKIFAEIADCIVVWGSDIAVKAAYQMASINTKVVAWGHKLSFAYATLNASDEDLINLAHHICQTNQLLCSSAQGIFVDTKDFSKLEEFAKRFFEIFVKTSKEHKPLPIGVRGKNTLELYTNHLEKEPKSYFSKNGVSVVIKDDSKLELSNLFRNVWVKQLPKENIIKELKPFKNYLQTVGLMCAKDEASVIIKNLKEAGLVRITSSKNTSRAFVGEAHDGTYALREYTRVVEVEKF